MYENTLLKSGQKIVILTVGSSEEAPIKKPDIGTGRKQEHFEYYLL